MQVLSLDGTRLITSQPTFAGKHIRLFEMRKDGWHENTDHSPFPDAPAWTRVSQELSQRLSKLEQETPDGFGV